jgi:hypothetical protein
MLKQTELAVAQSNEIYLIKNLYAFAHRVRPLKPFIIFLVNFDIIVNKSISVMKSLLNIKINRCLSILFSVVLLTATFSSCKKNNDEDNQPRVAIAVTNAASLSVPQDVYFDNQKVNAEALAYTKTIGYIFINGNPSITFTNASSTTANGTATADFVPGHYYSAYYAEDKSVNVFENDRTTPPTGKARIRFLNLGSGVGSSVDFGFSGGAKIVSGLTYKAASTYQDVDPTLGYSLYSGGSASVLLNIPITLQAGGIYTVYISGVAGTTLGYKLISEN